MLPTTQYCVACGCGDIGNEQMGKLLPGEDRILPKQFCKIRVYICGNVSTFMVHFVKIYAKTIAA
jgi:hypothetical protein